MDKKVQEELITLVSLMRREGVSRFRIADTEVEFLPTAYTADTLNSFKEFPLVPQEQSDEEMSKQDDENLY